MSYKANYNERSWAIDLIGYIKSYVASIDRPIKEAGGENSIIKEGSSLFPDVLLYGDSDSAKILQGWELKMPDTNINDLEFFENAKKKALTLGLDSMVLWNVKTAHLYILNPDTNEFQLVKVWSDLDDITSRQEVKESSNRWKRLSTKIIDTINDYLDDGVLTGKRFIEAYHSGGITSLILENTKTVSDTLNKKINTDKIFKARVTLWLEQNGQEYGATGKKDNIDILSRAILINWLGKFLFAHILTSTSTSARNLLKQINQDTTVTEALDIFQEISNQCNFWTIFASNLGMELLPPSVWSHFKSLNNLLNDLNIGAIDQSQLSSLLEETVSINSRKLKGQYTTPKPLAKLLVELSVNNIKDDRISDFCSGSGTIIREALEAKLKVSTSAKEASKSIYASDLDYHANQMTTFALAKPSGIDIPIRVFNADVFTLTPSCTLTFKEPRSGKDFQETLGYFDVILGNLPFISQDGRKAFTDSIALISDNLPNSYDFLNIKEAPQLSKKSDIYSYIPFKVFSLLKDGGTLGIIISNAWLGTDWGFSFFSHLIGHYHLKTVVSSGAGRWFQNSEVVANILILEKRKTNDTSHESIDFVTLKRPLADLEDNNYLSLLSSQILLGSVSNSESLDIRTVSTKDIFHFNNLGIGLNSQFVNCDWLLNEVPLIKVSSILKSRRGLKSSGNQFFYHRADKRPDIEAEFFKPLLKNLKNINRYSIVEDTGFEAFVCNYTESELISLGKEKAYNWIQAFKNNKGEPKTVSLQNIGENWHILKPQPKVDFVINLNISERFFFARVQSDIIIDQRVVCFKLLDNYDVELIHALLNSTLMYFLIEGKGFGRGLGVLDLKADSFKTLPMLNPNILNNDKKNAIKKAFEPLLEKSRVIYNIAEELESGDRIEFDRVVLESFGISHLQNTIYESLLKLVAIRLEATREL